MKNFFIKTHSTLPLLKFQLTDDILNRYSIEREDLKNVTVTFSMLNYDSGFYKIANTPAQLVKTEDRYAYPNDTLYSLVYQFKLEDTYETGNFIGEFKIDFLDDKNNIIGKLSIPDDDTLTITINDSITKTKKT